jgi:hypothetical protein
MPTTVINMRRFSVVSKKPFEDILTRLTATIGSPDMIAFQKALAAATNLAELQAVIDDAIGPSQLMEFARFNAGAVIHKARGRPAPRMLRLLVGNPLIMRAMAETTPDAAAYAPVTLLIDERPDGVHLSYDLVASLIAPYGSHAALDVARNLDSKVTALLESTANGANR